MIKIIVSSKNPVKINAVLEGFNSVYPNNKFSVTGISVASGVLDQPMSEEETMRGALNRVNNANKSNPIGDFWVGIEGGIEEKNDGMITFAWVVIKSKTQIGKGRTTAFYLPDKVSALIRQGKELGDADDIVFGKKNSKQQNGAIGILTSNVLTRTSAYIPAVIIALIPFKNPSLYK
jgi:inosine/xanthosine triphosphatase